MYVSTVGYKERGGTRITCEGNEAFLVGANERLPGRIEYVGREAGRKGELVCWISASMKRGGVMCSSGSYPMPRGARAAIWAWL